MTFGAHRKSVGEPETKVDHDDPCQPPSEDRLTYDGVHGEKTKKGTPRRLVERTDKGEQTGTRARDIKNLHNHLNYGKLR